MISVFLPTARRPSSLNEALQGLADQAFTNFETLIVYDFAERETAKVISAYRDRLCIREFHSIDGLVVCANRALEAALGDIFVRTDDDAVATPGWLDAIHESFASDPQIGGVTGPTTIPQENLEGRDLTRLYFLFKNGSFFWKILGKFYLDYVMEGRAGEVSQWLPSGAFTLGSNFSSALTLMGRRDVTNLEACNFAVRTQLLRRVGGFDPAYARGLGDYHEADASFKIKKLGYRLVFEPRAALEHHPSALGISKTRSNSYSRSHNFLRFYFRHIRPNDVSGWLRFFSYLSMLNAYWCWKAIVARDPRPLAGVLGTITGLIRFLPDLIADQHTAL